MIRGATTPGLTRTGRWTHRHLYPDRPLILPIYLSASVFNFIAMSSHDYSSRWPARPQACKCPCYPSHLGRAHTTPLVVADLAHASARLPVPARAPWPASTVRRFSASMAPISAAISIARGIPHIAGMLSNHAPPAFRDDAPSTRVNQYLIKPH